MTKKGTKNEAKKNAAKARVAAKSPPKLKLAQTGRIDAIAEIEKQAEVYRTARDARMEMQAEEETEQETLTDLLKKHGKREYVYEGEDGKKRRAYIPSEAKAKVQIVKPKKTANDDGEE